MLALSKDRELRAQWQRAARAVVPIMSPEKANQVSFSPRKRPITSGQIRAAWALIRWRAQDLAREPAVGVATIRRAELAETETSMTAANNLAVRRALEAAGVEFIGENGGGPGVRLRKRQQPKLLSSHESRSRRAK